MYFFFFFWEAGEFFALKRDLTQRNTCDWVSVDNSQNIKWYIHIRCCQYLAHLKLFEQLFPINFSGLEGVSGFWHLVGTYWLVFGQRVEWMINSVSKEVKSVIAFCHLWPLFNKVVCGLLGNCIVLDSLCFRNKRRLAEEMCWKGGVRKLQLWGPRLKVQMESQPWSLPVSALPSRGLWAQGSPSQKRAPDTHPQGERLEEQSHQDFTPLGTRELEQFSEHSWGAFLGRGGGR